ncbi:MAG: hypothetical protein DMF95_33945 [Acidobacteria bacterium]|nr:MAG: hypothetical protein DMF95_33945 [Acidobacteriota bacterium]
MRVVTPPWLSPAKQVQFLKGRSSRMLQRDFQHLHKRYWGNTCVPRVTSTPPYRNTAPVPAHVRSRERHGTEIS